MDGSADCVGKRTRTDGEGSSRCVDEGFRVGCGCDGGDGSAGSGEWVRAVGGGEARDGAGGF